MPNPKIIYYLRILHKINDIYSRYELNDKDLEDEITYYYNKDGYSEEEIEELQNFCEIEWKNVLIKLCQGLITKIESKENYKKILNVELNKARKVYQELVKEKKTLDGYEKLYDNKLNDFRDTVEKEIAKYGIENKRFNLSIIIAIIIAVGSIILGAYLQKRGLLNWI